MILERDMFVQYQSISGARYLVKEYNAFELDDIGVIIWESMDGNTSLEQITEMVATKYNVNKEVVIKDIQAFVKDLVDNGLAEEVKK